MRDCTSKSSGPMEWPLWNPTISFYGLGPKANIICQNQEHKMKWNKNHTDTLPFLLYFSSNCAESVSSRLQLCTKCWDLSYDLTIKGSVWALKRCKNCTNEVFHLRDTAILHYLFTSQPLCNLFIFRGIMANLSLCLCKHYKVNKNSDIVWNIINIGTKQWWVASFILQTPITQDTLYVPDSSWTEERKVSALLGTEPWLSTPPTYNSLTL